MFPIALTFSIFILAMILLLGIIIILNNPHSRINRSFFLVTIAGAFWIFANIISDHVMTKSACLLWMQLCIVGPSLISPLFLFLTWVFPEQRIKITIKKLVLVFSPSVAIIALTSTKWNISSFEMGSHGWESWTPGPLYTFLFIYFAIYFGIAIYNLVRSYRKGQKIQKLQIKYLAFGLTLSAISGFTTNFILPHFFNVISRGTSVMNIFGPTLGSSLAVFVFFVFAAYAVTKHHLMNIRIIATELFVGLMIALTFVNLLLAPSTNELIVRAIFLGLMIIFGWLLIKSTLREVRTLERMVRKRTGELSKSKEELAKKSVELEKRGEELEKWYRATVGRELKMIELKKEIKKLEEKSKSKEI